MELESQMTRNESARQIQVSEMAPHVHSFGFRENKVDKLTLWLKDWIIASLKSNKIKEGDFLPTKGDLAFHIGVSLGTMQSVFRRLEDEKLIESKQKIGTYIRIQKNETMKLTSKRDIALSNLKKYILKNLKLGDKLPTTRQLSDVIGVSATTIQSIIKILVSQGVVKVSNNKAIVINNNFEIMEDVQKTLSEKLSEEILSFVQKNYKQGEKIPSNAELAKKFNTSVKTIHDAIRILEKEGLLLAKRGIYGTIYAKENLDTSYEYEKILIKLKQYIAQNCQTGDKLPSMKIFSQQLNVSIKTIKNAMDILADEGFVTFARGRNGGTFVTDIPQDTKDTYAWIALNPDYIYNLEQPN